MSRSISSRIQLQARHQLLKQVKREIKQFRLQSLHRAVLTKLAKETPPLRMRRSWDVEAKVGKKPSIRLPADSGVIPVFDRIGGKLLILGATGSGKTTTLIGLAKALVSRALQDEGEPIPVLLNLRTWNPEQPLIADWLMAQIEWKYKIDQEISSYWLDQLQILPLLDGLDEVPAEYRDRCIQEINQLMQSHFAPLHLVTCSSIEAYYHCPTRLQLNGAILVKPLTKNQIRDYLLHAGSRELWHDIEEDENLLKLAQKPLLLSMMALAYEELLLVSWKRLPSFEDQIQYLFNAFIRRQITQNREFVDPKKSYSPEKVRQGLEWLAQRLEEENKVEFSIDEISVNWLKEAAEEQTYTWGIKIVHGIIWWGIILGIILGVITQSILFVLLFMVVGFIWGFVSDAFSVDHVIEKFVIRSVLSSKGYLPWKYKQFLNDAKKRLMMQQVGDRYQFIHRWLQQHFSQFKI